MEQSRKQFAPADVAARKSHATSPDGAGLYDGLGVFASLACAVHCAAMPWLVGLLPAIGLTWLADEAVHQWLLGVCFVLACCAFVPGYCRHRRLTAALFGVTGIGLLAWAVFVVPYDHCPLCEPSETGISPWLMPIGGLLLVVGHLTNRRCCRKCSARDGMREMRRG